LVLGLVLLGSKLVVDARVDAERVLSKALKDDVDRLEKELKLLESREEARVQAERRAVEFQELIGSQNRAEAIKRWPEISNRAGQLRARGRAISQRDVSDCLHDRARAHSRATLA
jgi:hypothetical protein